MIKQNRWTICWKCEQDIMTQPECFYVHSREGKLNFCRNCYDQFINIAYEFIQPDRIEFQEKRIEMRRAMHRAQNLLHYKEHSETKDQDECDECKSMLHLQDEFFRWEYTWKNYQAKKESE
jgi:hypothetical protein